VLDYLGETLRLVGTTQLSVQTWEHRRPHRGVVVPARSWEDYLSLSADEIREYGAGGIQIMRRLRALLEELHDEVRPEYRAAVKDELLRLDATVTSSWENTVDFERART